MPIYKQESEQWKEWTYPVWIIQDTLHDWLRRSLGQPALRGLEVGAL